MGMKIIKYLTLWFVMSTFSNTKTYKIIFYQLFMHFEAFQISFGLFIPQFIYWYFEISLVVRNIFYICMKLCKLIIQCNFKYHFNRAQGISVIILAWRAYFFMESFCRWRFFDFMQMQQCLLCVGFFVCGGFFIFQSNSWQCLKVIISFHFHICFRCRRIGLGANEHHNVTC
eukprot:EC096511.1.p1 GENE.EC096511.1~~EC096511.1.p1  ORF type:complete len:172 (+),score=1.02 EC096511.1:84-599(+)